MRHRAPGWARRIPTARDRAVDAARAVLAAHQAALAEAAENEAADAPRGVTAADRAAAARRMAVLAALLRGPHQAAVWPLVRAAWPDLDEALVPEDRP